MSQQTSTTGIPDPIINGCTNGRVIRHDKKGVYVTHDRRRYRPSSPTAYAKGDRCSVSLYHHSKSSHVVDKQAQVVVAIYTGYPPGHPKHSGGNYPTYIYEREEVWECHDADPRIRERLKSGFHKFKAATTRGTLEVVVAGDDGYDYGQFRKDPQGYKARAARFTTRGINVHLHISNATSGHAQMTWEEWDKLVKEVEDQRHNVQVAPIAMKLQEEVDLDDQLQEYIKEKGLDGA